MSTRSLVLVAISLFSGIGLVIAGQPWLALPTAVAVLGGLHTLVDR